MLDRALLGLLHHTGSDCLSRNALGAFVRPSPVPEIPKVRTIGEAFGMKLREIRLLAERLHTVED